MNYVRFISFCADQVWAIKLEKYLAAREFILQKAAGLELTKEEIEARVGERSPRPDSAGEKAIAVIPVYGIISQRISLMDEVSGPGSSSTDNLSKQLKAALADPRVSSILLDVDSPGGTVYGVDELSAEIFKARGQKPIVAIVNSLAASAAYYIASAADEIYITPSGEAGSIGVFAEHVDASKALETAGLKPTLIFAGEYKTEGNPYQPLSSEGLEYYQSRVNEYYNMFLEAVARNRGVTKTKVKNDFGKGRVFGARQALAAGMVDKIGTFDQVIRKLGGEPQTILAQELMQAAPQASNLVEGTSGDKHCGPIAPHKTVTSDEPWDGPDNEARLPSPMSVETARNAYAWMEDNAIDDGQVKKTDCRFIHHEVSEAGRPGAANLSACSTGIGVLNGGRGGTTIPDADRQGVYDHLAKHLRDADKEPPPLKETAENNLDKVPEDKFDIEIERRRLELLEL